MNSCELVPTVGSHKELITKLKNSEELNYILLNIDNFSNINHAYGYEMGSIALCQVIKYLNVCKPLNSEIYRYSTDKFVLIENRKLDHETLSKIAESMLSFFSQTEIILSEEVEFRVSLSIGISVDKGLINITQAELAVRESRKSQRNSFIIFDKNSEFVKGQDKDIYWILKIKEAVEHENIIAYFQPIVNNSTGKIEKFECLARVRDADEIISPYMFMNAAKVTGNLSFLTRSLISQSFKKFSKTDYDFSLNITDADLSLEYLEFVLIKNAKKYNIDPSRVVLEMLEDITSLDSGTTLIQLKSLREKGFKIAIDDFGAENSNMSRLLEIHPDYLKIDGAFIKNIATDVKSQIIVEAIVLMCKKSGIKVIAEYVHNKEVQKIVKSLGIDYSQGYYFGKPEAELTEHTVSV